MAIASLNSEIDNHYCILIADDHPLFREALIARIRGLLPTAEIIEVSDVPGLQNVLTSSEEIDLLLLDLNMPGAQGLSALVHARALAPSVAIVVISAMDDAAVIQRAISLGAAGFIPKSATLAQISSAINEVLRGQISIPSTLVDGTEYLLTDAESNAARRIGLLTPQQFRIASLLAAGKLNKQIAWELDITEATVKVHMSAILRKLNAQNRTQVALLIHLLDFEHATGNTRVPDEVRRV